MSLNLKTSWVLEKIKMTNSKHKLWTLSKNSITSWIHSQTSASFQNQLKTALKKANKLSLSKKKFLSLYGMDRNKFKKMEK